MIKISRVTASKPNPGFKLGIKYTVDATGMTITAIFDDSIFSSTGLRVGHEVVRINGSAVSGNDREWVRAVMASAGDTIFF